MPRDGSSLTLAAIEAARSVPSGLGFLDMHGGFKLAKHLQLIDEALCDVEAGRCKRLIIEVPPRHGKSLLISKYFVAWYIGRNRDHRVMLASYGADLASDFGRAARDVLEQWGSMVFGVGVSPASSAANRWDIKDHAGGMTTAGVGGPMTGRGAHVLVIDDPLKNQEDAQSTTIREKHWNWFTSTAYTRLEPDGAVIVVQTRWHEDDLAGRLQAAAAQGEGEEYRVIRLPAIAEAGDSMGRVVGAPLWPERYGAERLEAIRKSVGSYVWNALYQQRPVAPAGNVVKRDWFRFYRKRDLPEAWDRQEQSWDLTFKDSDGSDFVAGHVWAETGADSYLLHRVKKRMDYPTTKAAIRTMSAAWPDAHTKLIEDKANGPAIMAELGRELGGLVAVEPQGGKMARLVAASPQIEGGNVWLPHPDEAPWVEDFLAEVCAFPNAPHDDDVDAMTQHLVRKIRRSRPRLRSFAA